MWGRDLVLLVGSTFMRGPFVCIIDIPSSGLIA